MNKSSILTSILLIPTFALSLASCGNANNGIDVSLFNKLQQGFKAVGTLKAQTRYFEDEEHVVPANKIKDLNQNLKLSLSYTDTDNYIGNDYKIYDINEDGTETLIIGENMYNFEGYLMFNSVGYNNTKIVYGNVLPYGSSTSLNPFTLVKSYDFMAKDNIYTLDEVKSDIFFADLMYNMMFIPANINVETLDFVVKDDTLTNIKAKTNPIRAIQTIDLVNYYTETTFEVDFNISEVGTCNTYEEIQVEPEKSENRPLRKALDKFDRASSYLVSRHFKTPLDAYEETIDTYFSSQQQAVYMQVYDSHTTTRPDKPGEADALFVDTVKDSDHYLNAYMLQPSVNDETKLKFKPAAELNNVNNVFTFAQFMLPKFAALSENVFNKNDDGSYSPIPEHLEFIASDLFVPFLNTTNEIAGGYVNSFKLYLTEDESNLDRIELDTQISDIIGHVTIKYEQLNNCVIPFNALEMIEE